MTATCTNWSIDTTECDFLQDFVRLNGLRKVLEFGPGLSTCALLDCGCHVWSLECDAGWFEAWSERLHRRAGLELVLFQNLPELEVPELDGLRFDMAFVDGPPGCGYQHFSRLNAVDFAAGRTDCVMLHDAKRQKEANTLLLLRERGWQIRVLESRRGLAIATRPKCVVRLP